MSRQELWRKLQLLLIVACGTYPAVMVVLNIFAPELFGWGWVFSAAYVVLAFAAIQVKGRVRMTVGIAMAIAGSAAAFFLTPKGTGLGCIAASVLCIGLLVWSLKIGGWSQKDEIPVFWVAIGIVCHIIGQLLIRADNVSGGEGLARHSGMFLAALYQFSLLTMLSMNRKSLTQASGKRQSVPQTMRTRNGLLTTMLFVLAVLVSLLPSAFAGLSEIIGQGIAWLVAFIIRLIPDAPNESEFSKDPAATMPVEGMEQGGEEGLVLNPFVEKFAAFVGALLAIALAAFLLYRIYGILREKLQEMVKSLTKFAANVSEDYVDEITDTREDGTAEKLERRRRTPRLTAREERSLPPEERIRYRYRRILSRHPEWEPGSTAREKLPEELARVYEHARYSGMDVTEEQAAAFTGGTEKI